MAKRYTWKPEGNGVFTLYLDVNPLLSASASAKDADTGCVIDTREAALKETRENENGLTLTYENESGLVLTERLTVTKAGAIAQCSLCRKDGDPVRTNSLTPLIAHSKGDETPYLWRDLRPPSREGYQW